MSEPDDGLKILASAASAQRISRRAFMGGSAVAVFSGGVLLSACSNSSGASAASGGSSAGASPVLEDKLNFLHWAAYDDPKLFKKFTQEFGPATSIDTYASNEEAITKLVAAAGSSGYDIVVPTGPYIPQMVANNLLQELDLSKIPNFKNLETPFTNQPWDPGNKHSVCKDWGTVGWIVDKSQISRPINTWSDFIDVAMNEASGNVSLLDAQNEVMGVYFWANGIDWTTTDPADLDAYEAWTLQMAPHVKAFESYPGYQFANGNYALSHVWNGDARQGFNSFKDPSRYAWGIGSPSTELWMDNWTIVQGAPHPEAAYAFINFILDPKNSLQDLAFHGYNTGITGIEDAAKAAGFPFLDMIFFDDAQLATMHAQEINSAFDREVAIFLKMKAAGGGLGGRVPQRGAVSVRGARCCGAPRFAMALPAWIWFVFFFSLPVLWIVYYSFGYKPDIYHPIATDKLSFATYREAFSSTFLHVFSQTLQISILGTILCFLIAFPFAYWLATRVASRWRGLLLGLVVVPFFVNFLVRTIGWFILLSPAGPVSNLLQRWGLRSEPLHLLQTRGAVQLGVVYNYLALMILPLFVTLDRLDPAMREASKDLGASRWKTFRQVTLPLAAPGIVAGLLLVFIPLTGDYITALVLGGAKGNMAGVLVASQFTIAQDWALGAAQAVILIAMIMGTVAVFAVIALAIRTIARATRTITLPPIVEETA